MNIDLKQLEELLKVLEERDVSEFEFEDEKVRVHLKRGRAAGLLSPPLHYAGVSQYLGDAASAPPPGADSAG